MLKDGVPNIKARPSAFCLHVKVIYGSHDPRHEMQGLGRFIYCVQKKKKTWLQDLVIAQLFLEEPPLERGKKTYYNGS